MLKKKMSRKELYNKRMIKQFQSFFPMDDRLFTLAERAEARCQPVYDAIAERAAYNGAKVLAAFQKNHVSEPCFYGSTGYGYGDQGREILDKVVADTFGAEDALVRHNFVSGTHALTVALFGILRTGDRMVSMTGRPYDTLEGVIGLTGKAGDGSLKDYGVIYDEIPLLKDGTPDYDAIPQAVKGAKVAYIQRSRGYTLRPAFTLKQIEKMAQLAHSANPDVIVMVDNCYGEFTNCTEPVQHGADLMIGSMIKNVGGGIARTGGYIAGKKELVTLCSYRLTCVGMGKEVGCTLDMNRDLFLGFFHAPDATANALKTAVFAASLFELLGFACYPRYDAPRNDIVEAICLGDEAHLTSFCQGIQSGSPVDAFVVPEAWDMPGYTNKVIMAAGTFTAGASIELSADAPIREPFAVWMQGGITEASGKIGVLLAAQKMLQNGLLPTL
jgi:cystathionine beta-lyase family protein involved in aluminum resistance